MIESVADFVSWVETSDAPEQITLRVAEGGSEMQSKVEALLKRLSADSKRMFQDSVLKMIMDSNTVCGQTDWPAVEKQIARKMQMGRALWGDRYADVLKTSHHNAKIQRFKTYLKQYAPIYVITLLLLVHVIHHW